eukprot:14431826-Alexandrium_andersonii.AAC.1
MSASLVGSEMCIRDRAFRMHGTWTGNAYSLPGSDLDSLRAQGSQARGWDFGLPLVLVNVYNGER